MRKKLCLFLSIMTLVLASWAQEKVPITGKVVNAGTKQPLEGITVQVKGTNQYRYHHQCRG